MHELTSLDLIFIFMSFWSSIRWTNCHFKISSQIEFLSLNFKIQQYFCKNPVGKISSFKFRFNSCISMKIISWIYILEIHRGCSSLLFLAFKFGVLVYFSVFDPIHSAMSWQCVEFIVSQLFDQNEFTRLKFSSKKNNKSLFLKR